MNELLTAVRDGRHHEVPPLVLALDRPGRRAALAELKELRKEARGWDWRRRDRIRKGLLVAGAGCHTGAAACAAWIGGRDLRDWGRSPYPLILASLKDRDPAWLGDLARRFAVRAALSDAEYTFVCELARTAGVPLPAADNLVVGWTELAAAGRWRGRTRRSLADVLRDDPHSPCWRPGCSRCRSCRRRSTSTTSRSPGTTGRGRCAHWSTTGCWTGRTWWSAV